MYEQKEVNLPVKTHSLLTYSPEAALLSVLYTNPRTFPWIYSNFVNWCSFEHQGDNLFLIFYYPSYGRPMFESCPEHVDYVKIERDIISKSWGSITKLLLDVLQLGYYAYFYYDQYYVSFTKSYLKKHFTHEVFVLGYNIESETFNCADFVNGHYVYRTAAFAEIENAYQNISLIGSWQSSCVWLFKIKNNSDYNFNKELFTLYLKDFLLSKNSFDIYEKTTLCYGIDVYNACIDYLNRQIVNPAAFDFRFANIMYIHKVFMLERLDFFLKNGHVGDVSKAVALYEKIRDCAKILTGLSIKHNAFIQKGNMSEGNVCLHKAIKIIEDIADDDKLAAQILLNGLK